MNDSSNFSPAERLESLKAGTLAAVSAFLAFAVFTTSNSLLQVGLQVAPIDVNLALRGAIALLSGFLFGVTYRYAIRRDTNPQLKAGATFAFGLVRASAQLDVGLSGGVSILSPQNFWPLLAMGLESVGVFAIAALALDFARQRDWIKPFNSN